MPRQIEATESPPWPHGLGTAKVSPFEQRAAVPMKTMTTGRTLRSTSNTSTSLDRRQLRLKFQTLPLAVVASLIVGSSCISWWWVLVTGWRKEKKCFCRTRTNWNASNPPPRCSSPKRKEWQAFLRPGRLWTHRRCVPSVCLVLRNSPTNGTHGDHTVRDPAVVR